jgi:CAAX prenyl protease-like protein
MTPYVLPFVLYLVLTQIAAAYPEHYSWTYPAVVIVAGAATVWLLRGRQLFMPHRRIFPGVFVGFVGIVLWIGICRLEWDERLAALLPSSLRPGPRLGFNPFMAIPSAAAQWAFVTFRLIGLALLVPVIEELFWRGFLARWLLAPQWQSQALGHFTPFSFIGVTLLFTLAHPEWLAAAVYCILLNLLLAWTRDLWNCIVAHGVSNLALGIYVLATDSWQLW